MKKKRLIATAIPILAFAAAAWTQTIISAFSNDPEARAKEGRYVLK